MVDPADRAGESREWGSSQQALRATVVAVVGSANIDHISSVRDVPLPGETILADHYVEGVGGKGFNQAVGSARHASTALIAAVGDDSSGQLLRERAHARGIDVTGMHSVAGETGQAFITLLPGGENIITVAALANSHLTPDMVTAELNRVSPAVVLVQFEIPLETVRAALDWAELQGVRVIVNPSPLSPEGGKLLSTADPLIVNTGEAAALLGKDGTALEMAQELSKRCRSVIVTAGGAGAAIADQVSAHVVPVPNSVVVIDSSGAGDEFAGNVASAIARGMPLFEAANAGVSAASEIVSKDRSRRC